MLSKVADFIARQQLLSRSSLHLVALSGGADSVALLTVLLQLGYRVEAVHCNFHLRGDESERDEMFVKELCGKHEIELHLIHFDTREYASIHQVSIEMAARELRYRYFGQLCRDIGAETVCVAHHRDDAVETLLMNLIRGTGIHGLTGIRPQNGQVVRPLLCVSRQEIEDYLHSIRQDYVIDSTNLMDDAVRNKIRLRLIPLLREINPKAVENIDKTANFLQDAVRTFDSSMQDQLLVLVKDDKNTGAKLVSVPQLLQQPSPMSFLYQWLSPYGFNSTQIQQVFTHLTGQSGKCFYTPTHVLVIDRDTLVLEPVHEPMKTLKIPETGRYVYAGNLRFDFAVQDGVCISKSADCATVDASKVQFPFIIRPVREGDVFIPFGMEGHKLVSDFLTDTKLSVLDKRRQLVVTDSADNILWLVGLRTDNRYRVTEQTSQVLRIMRVRT